MNLLISTRNTASREGCVAILLAALCWGLPDAGAAGLTPADREFFDQKVRPILTERCYSCHSESKGKVKAGLQLDWREGWQKGGDTGPALVPGEPEKSLLIKAVRFTDPELKMPPKGERLTADQVGILVEWVQRGAPDPRDTPDGTVAGSWNHPKDHWAFKPVQRPAVPAVGEASWAANPVDAFVLASLEKAGLPHSGPADKHTLLRRIYFDLIGLPPTPQESQEFLGDTSPDAFEKVVDRLLASPHYGERWGRYWLDVARYSDTKGQFKRQKESSVYPNAWTYRDYVIDAFNSDKPYDQFIREQLAADRLPAFKGGNSLAALGFLTVGDRYNGNENDIINDRIDVVTKGFLGLTVTCARCHDHRFDPIPTADYYSLHGIFSSSVEPAVRPLLPSSGTNSPAYASYLREKSELEGRMTEVSSTVIAQAFGDTRRLAGVYLFATTLGAKEASTYLTNNGANPELLKNWDRLAKVAGRRDGGIFRLWQAMQRVPAARFPEQARRILSTLGRDERTRNLPTPVIDAFRGRAPKNLAELAALYGQLFANPDPAWQAQIATALREPAINIVPNRLKGRFFVLREQLDRLDMTHEGAPARAMALYDSMSPKDSPIFIRGEAENKGEVVPRRFLEILSGGRRPVFTEGSGRLQLANAIASPECAMTARVMVNRVWQHHFGEGFVLTPDDLGNQSSPPSNPQLLDWLAAEFMHNGWSIKKLHRQIVLSNTYRQASEPSDLARQKDPDNRLLSHANVRRLEFEPLRDSILYVSGKLDLTVGGKPVDLSEGTHRSSRKGAAIMDRLASNGTRLSVAGRRSVYGYIDREDLLEVLNTFDFANPTLCSGRRYETTVPQQALFLMNSPLVVEQARNITQRPDFQAVQGEEERIRFLYALLFQRIPTPSEIQLGKSFLAQWMPPAEVGRAEPAVTGQAVKKGRPNRPGEAKAAVRPLGSWAEYAHALIMTTEMSFVQ